MAKRKKTEESDINENILNIITPTGIDYDATYANIGENIGKIYCISKYPTNVQHGWLASLCNLEGTATTIEFRHTAPDRMKRVMDKKISELRSNKETAKEESEKQKIQKAIEDLQQMINRISVQNEPVGYVNIMQFVQGTNIQEFNSRIKRISSTVAIAECNLRNLKYRQLPAMKAIAPYGIPNVENVSNQGERNMPISSFVGGFPMANAGLNDTDGYYIGKSKNNRIVRLNMWARNKDRTNSNWIITGIPGVGKSTAIKTIFAKEHALGTKIIIMDPETEYKDMALHTNIQGDVVNCTGGDKGRINPLQVRSAPRITKDDFDDGEKIDDYFTYTEEYGTSDLALYIQQLRVFFRMYFGDKDFTFDVKTILEQCLIEVYKSFGITWDTDVRKLKNKDFPIMSDLYEYVAALAEYEKEEYLKGVYRKLELLLYSCGKGADQFIWNGPTTLNPQSTFIDLDMSSLQEADDNVKRAQYYNIAMWGWQQIANDRTERVLLGVDEGYLFVDPEYPDLMKFLRNVTKRSRKYEGGFMFITHSGVDILDESVKRYGQAIIDNACYKFIMGADGKNLQEIQNLFKLSEREVNILSGKNRGQGIFMCGNIRMDLKIDVADEFLEMFGSAGGR